MENIDSPIKVIDNEFEKKVLNSPLPVIVEFWATWCVPCKFTGPILENIAKEYAGKLIVAKVNVDVNYMWAEIYNVRSIPTMLFITNRKVAYRQVGALPEQVLKQIVNEFLHTVEGSYNIENLKSAT